MQQALGILCALGALVSWGIGDYFIQRTTRLVGSWRTLFYNTAITAVLLFPFVAKELPLVFKNTHWLALLFLTTVIILFTALFDFEALKRGKLAVIEPLLGIELPLTVALSITFAGEQLAWLELTLIGVVFSGIVLAVTQHHTRLHYHKRIFEKGVILAGIGAIAMALMNFFVGVSSQEISPLMTIWFTDAAIAVIAFLYLVFQKEISFVGRDLARYSRYIFAQGIIDNAAWVFFAFAATLIPIAITTAISESYIALAVLLGIAVNREKLQTHQLVGVVLAVSGVILLSIVTIR